MKANFEKALPGILAHEGGFVNHPKDPGGATNKGITIGTLKQLGIDVDGDGDSDIVDLKALRHEHVARVYKLFYWDAVKADLLPSGVDYTVADFAVNSGPSRAAKHLQAALGVPQDGDIGPKTLAAMERADPAKIIEAIFASRMRFLRGLKTWPTFGKGWTRRVTEVRSVSLAMAMSPAVTSPAPHVTETPKIEHVQNRTNQNPIKKPAPAGPAIVVGGIIAAAVALVSGGWDWLTSWF